ncbi:uncharacterized protein ARMOST_20100 [Armillaria ostoyae]|uniref:Uncharacterized protein n=1 Tax=Armillaria ostoyae TaxID=47428 RepID=A0A284S6E0_ARMOS|nr:uncharacterized protein ARMOST_20100 [Armillaria ostoyae]
MASPLKLQLKDLTKFSSCYKGNLSINDGFVGTYLEDQDIFITTTNNSFIPYPPTACKVCLYEDGRFGHHDPIHVPQFFEERFCHFPAIPHKPLVTDLNHPYYQWLDTIWYDVTDSDIVFSSGYLSHIGSNQNTRDKFADISGIYAPSPIPAWAAANVNIDCNLERSQQRECQAQQSQRDGNTKKDYNKGYAFPDPGLLVHTSATRQSTYFCQWEHYRDSLIYRISSSASNATPLHPQVWRELLAMPFKKQNVKLTKAHSIMLEIMGTALQTPGTKTTLRVPAADVDQPFDVERGQYLI